MGVFLTKAVLTRRSEKSILVKMTRFCVFQRIFKIFSKFKKSETSNLLQVNFLEYRNHHINHTCSQNRIFGVFWTPKIAAILGVQKTPKMRFYEQI